MPMFESMSQRLGGRAGVHLGVGLAAAALWVVASMATGCTRRVQPIDLKDETIPVEARELVADAEDAIAIARAERDRAREDLERTRDWRDEILGRDWPSGADSILGELRRLADARVRLEELRVQRAEERIELAEARYRLITARTAIRQDLAVYDLEPLKEEVDEAGGEVDAIDEKIESKRGEVAQMENDWWNRYADWVDQGNDSRSFYVELQSLKPRESAPGPSGSGREGESGKEGASSKSEGDSSKGEGGSTSDDGEGTDEGG